MHDSNGIDLWDREARLAASLDRYRADAARAEVEHDSARARGDALAADVWGRAWHELFASITRVEEKLAQVRAGA